MSPSVQKALAVLSPVLAALLLIAFLPAQQKPVDQRLQLHRIKVVSAAELEAAFDRLGYEWPPGTNVPPVEVVSLPPDLGKLRDVDKKKSLFFRTLLPIILAENETLVDLRANVVRLLGKGLSNLSDGERGWLRAIASQYKVDSIETESAQRRLLQRVDTLPTALVLAQAANESAWGTSRFARLGNNLFGQWTYQESLGIIPLKRPDGAAYAVRAFPSLDASVRAYLRNLNTNSAYEKLRLMRQRMREAGEPLDAHRLATGLAAYSSRGEEYIQELQLMMRGNGLMNLLDSVSLQRSVDGFSQSTPAGSRAG